jgi:sugar lactone lactonase YvrE
MLDNISVSNGMGWSPDNRIMYFTDSFTLQVFAFDYDLLTGSISNRRTVVKLSDGEGTPDGLTVDEEGMLWVAQWRGWKLCRWNPHTGERLLSIPMPAERVSSCTFGGDNWDELYITTARVSQSEEVLTQYPYAGGVFRMKPGIKGLPTCSFKG